MSAGVIRDTFRQALTDYLAANRPTVPFVDSITNDSLPSPPLWVTASFFPTDTIPLTCEQSIEQGTCQVNVYGEGGITDTSVIALADELGNYFDQNPELQNGVSVTRVSQPTEATSGDGVAWYGVTVAVDYLAKI